MKSSSLNTIIKLGQRQLYIYVNKHVSVDISSRASQVAPKNVGFVPFQRVSIFDLFTLSTNFECAAQAHKY